jgi:hypothetical protein
VLPKVAVIVTLVADVTELVVTEKLTDDAPAGTVLLAGTVAAVLFDAKLTTVPDGPAGPLKRIVATLVPPVTPVGAIRSPLSVAGANVVVELSDAVPTVAVIFTGVLAFTALVFWRYQKLE